MQASLFLSFAFTAIIGIGYTAPVPTATTSSCVSIPSVTGNAHAEAKETVNNTNDDEEDDDGDEEDDSDSAKALSTPSNINPDDAAGRTMSMASQAGPSDTGCFWAGGQLFCPDGDGTGCSWRMASNWQWYVVRSCPHGCRKVNYGSAGYPDCY